MTWFRQLVGATVFLLVGVVFIVADLLLWLAMPIGALFPRAREPLLRFFARMLSRATIELLKSSGARFDIRARVPCEGGILIVSNHQSVVDIPVSFACVPDGYPQMVAHHRYRRGIPLVSHMVRAYRHIPVYPGRTGRAELERLGALARAAEHPVVIFPEGHRTRDGEIRPWKRAGLEAFLSARPWRVYVLVIDGLWRSARIPDFVRTISGVRCRAEAKGPMEYDGRARASHGEFIDRLENVMSETLAEMRRAGDETPRRAAADTKRVVPS